MANSVTGPGQCVIQQVESLDKAGYEIVRNSILKNLLAYGTMTSEQLGSLVESHLRQKFYGLLWQHYFMVLDMLVAHGEVCFVLNTHPPLIELNGA